MDHLLKGRTKLVVGIGIYLGLRSLEVSQLDLNLIKEEFNWVFCLYGFCPN